MDLTQRDPARLLGICFEIARTSIDPWVMENLGAGPLETLLGEDPNLLDALEIELGSNPALRVALGSIWRSGLPDHTWQTLQRLVWRSAR